jgi:hypothetical protein
MATELDLRTLDAILKARRVKERADLLEQARGKWTWRSVVPGVCLSVLATVLVLTKNFSPAPGVLPAFIFILLVASLAESRTSARLDAIAKLLQEATDEHGSLT